MDREQVAKMAYLLHAKENIPLDQALARVLQELGYNSLLDVPKRKDVH